MYYLFTDGSYSSARNQGGLAVIILKGNKIVFKYSKGVLNTTNNKMELGAIIVGLKAIKKHLDQLIIITDSMYCIGCATKGWKRKKNVKLWNIFDEEYARVSNLCPKIEWKHVKGHQASNNLFTTVNNMCDKMAVSASQQLL